MREAPPPYRGEGRHALWHVSEDPSITRFEPRDGKVWAIGTRLLPLYWFPRDCPRRAARRPGSRSEPRRIWDSVVASTLGFSGIRLRNARMLQ